MWWGPGCLLEHGGYLSALASRYGLSIDNWLDLSTGINPRGWPVPALPPDAWQHLPAIDEAFLSTAARYYGSPHLLPVAGSQAAIQALPRLRKPSKVAILSPTYAEHPRAWQRAGHGVHAISPDVLESSLAQLDVLVLANPNNPTGQCYDTATLRRWQAQLAERGGWLVVDEAFMDSTPEQSLAAEAGRPGLIILRSLGKFFGLAGARVGFVLAWGALLQDLREELGPWSVSGPSQAIARMALADSAWQQNTRAELHEQARRLARLLEIAGLKPAGGSSLFQYVPRHDAPQWHEHLARYGIATRLFSEPQALRFGLPGSEAEWQWLERALSAKDDRRVLAC